MKTATRFLAILPAFLFLFSCKKENVDAITVCPVVNDPEIKMDFFFRGTIKGVRKDWSISYKADRIQTYYFNSASILQPLGEDCQNTFCKYMTEDVVFAQNNGTGPTTNYIAAGMYVNSKSGERTEIIQQFAPGPKAFGKPPLHATNQVMQGVFIYYIDENGKEWCSHFGSGNQTNSQFQSTQLLTQPFPSISCYSIWGASFSCTLYDKNENAIELTNGEIFSPVFVKK